MAPRRPRASDRGCRGLCRDPAGRRVGLVAAEVPADPRQARTSRIEALASGWVYVGPCARDRATVQAVLPEAPADPRDGLARLLAGARLAAAGPLASPPVLRAAAPRLAWPVTSGRRLQIGDAALALDPLAGDGVGHALGAPCSRSPCSAPSPAASPRPPASPTTHSACISRSCGISNAAPGSTAGQHAGLWADECRMTTAALARAGAGGREDGLAYRLEARDHGAELLPIERQAAGGNPRPAEGRPTGGR